VLRKIQTFRGESAFFHPWLTSGCCKPCADALRKKTAELVGPRKSVKRTEIVGGQRGIQWSYLLLAGSIDRVNLERASNNWPPVTNWSSSFMTSKVTSTKKSPNHGLVRSGIESPAHRAGRHLANCCGKASTSDG